MKRTTTGILALSMAGALVLAACGSNEDSIAPTTRSAPSTTTSLTPAITQQSTTTQAPTTTTTTTTLPPEPEAPALHLEVTGFPNLTGGAHYEGWAIIEGTPVSTGKFNVVEDSIVSLDGQAIDRFEVDANLAAASTIVITIEPAGDTDAVPTETHLVAGDLGDASATLTIAHRAAIGTDFRGRVWNVRACHAQHEHKDRRALRDLVPDDSRPRSQPEPADAPCGLDVRGMGNHRQRPP